MAAARTGSFPIMNLAADLGVDYGDLLLVTDHYRRKIQNDNTTPHRRDAEEDAAERMQQALQCSRASFKQILNLLSARADVRWGR